MPKTEVEKFLEDTENSIEEIDKVEEIPAKDADPENVPESLKNRQHRRLEQKLQAEREANIILNERLKAKEEAIQHVVKDLPVDARIKRIFGDDTPEKLELARHFTEILSDNKREAKEEAIRESKLERERERQAEQEKITSYQSKIETGLESIEDEYNVDLTSENAVDSRKKFLDFVTKIAPKDADGSPSDLPDLLGAYEIFKNSSSTQPKNTRQKEIAARSMQQSGKVNLEKEEMTEAEKWLVQNGIIKKRK